MAPTIDALLVADEPDAWRAAGFTVDDDGACCVGDVRIELLGRDHGKRIVGWKLREVDDGSLDGLATISSKRAPCRPATHANGVVGLDHVVVLSPDLERTATAFEAAGILRRRTREVPAEQYGFEARQVFFKLGAVVLELIGGKEPTGDGPASFFGLAHVVADIDATQRHLGPLLPNVKDAVQPGRRIATLRHREVAMSVATAFMTPEPA